MCQHWISVVWITYLLSGLYKGLQGLYQNVYMNFSLWSKNLGQLYLFSVTFLTFHTHSARGLLWIVILACSISWRMIPSFINVVRGVADT